MSTSDDLTQAIHALNAFTDRPGSKKRLGRIRASIERLVLCDLNAVKELSQATGNLLGQLSIETVKYDDGIEALLNRVRKKFEEAHRSLKHESASISAGLDELLGEIDLEASGGFDVLNADTPKFEVGDTEEQPEPDLLSTTDSFKTDSTTAQVFATVTPLQKSMYRKLDSFVRAVMDQIGHDHNTQNHNDPESLDLLADLENQADALKVMHRELQVTERNLHELESRRSGVDAATIANLLSRRSSIPQIETHDEKGVLNKTVAVELCGIINNGLDRLKRRYQADSLSLHLYMNESEFVIEIAMAAEEFQIEKIRELAIERDLIKANTLLDDHQLVQFAWLLWDADHHDNSVLKPMIEKSCAVDVSMSEDQTLTFKVRLDANSCILPVITFLFEGDVYALFENDVVGSVSIFDSHVDLQLGTVDLDHREYPILNGESKERGEDILLLDDQSPAAIIVTSVAKPQDVLVRSSSNEFALPFGFNLIMNGLIYPVISARDLIHRVLDTQPEASYDFGTQLIQIVEFDTTALADIARRLKAQGYEIVSTSGVREHIASFQERHPALILIHETAIHNGSLNRLFNACDLRNTHVVSVETLPLSEQRVSTEVKSHRLVNANEDLMQVIDQLLSSIPDTEKSQAVN